MWSVDFFLTECQNDKKLFWGNIPPLNLGVKLIHNA